MTISKKITFLIGGLSLIIVLFATNKLVSAWSENEEMKALSNILDNGRLVASFVHEMQVERGLTAGYLASKGEKNKESLLSQRSKVDHSFLKVKSISVSSLPKEQAYALKSIHESEAELMRKRDLITSLSISPDEAIGFYSVSIKNGIDFMNNTVAIADIARASQALRMLITAKEYAGQERAVGNSAFTANKFADADAMRRFISLGAQRRVLLDEFLKLAPPMQGEKLIVIRNSELFSKLTQMETGAIAKALAGEPLNTSAADWFAASSQRINEFKAIEDELNLALIQVSQQHSNKASNEMMLFLALLVLLVLLIGWLYVAIVDKSIRKPLQQIRERINVIVSSGQFNQRIGYDAQDEIGDTARSMNQLFINLEKIINESTIVVTALSQGDFSNRITSHYAGDLEYLKCAINDSVVNTNNVMNNVIQAVEELKNGNLKIKIKTDFPGSYGLVLISMSGAMESISKIINDISIVMKAMNEGDFDARVNTLAHGDLLSMKNNVNDSMDRLRMVVTDIISIASAQSNGDLTLECRVNSNGQLKQLQDAINTSSRKLKSIVAQAVDASQIVNEAALQVSQGSSDLSSRVQEQAAALEQTSATMHEMASAVQNNTANARKVADLAHQVQHQAGEGVGVMQQTIGAMQSIHEASSKISDIVSIIDGIAFQTNLLALNAAVEAARAGEHGRGFAVVASEVRALAQKSAEAAKDIKGLIDDSVQRVENGTQLAEKSGSVLNGITASIEQVAGMVEEIATASNEQSTGISQVHNAMADIDRVTQENAALVEETTAAAQSLSSEAKDLRESMAFFKTGQQSNAHYHQPKQKQAHKSVKSLPSRRAVPALPAPNSRSANEWSEF